jgi:hypothetical protein
MAQLKEAAEVLMWLDGGGEAVERKVSSKVKIIPVWQCCGVTVGIVAS